MFKILIVEDEYLDNEGLKTSLTNINPCEFMIETACNGFEALDKLKYFNPDILVSDINMPGMNGMELASRIKEALPDISIIFISGHDDLKYFKNAIKLGAFEYLLKPVDENELQEIFEKVTLNISKRLKLAHEKSILKKRVDESIPVMRERVLQDILFGTINSNEIWERIRYLNIDIQEGSYCVLLLEIDDYSITSCEEAKSLLEKKLEYITAEAELSEYSICDRQFARISASRWALILSFNSFIQETDRSEAVLGIAGNLLNKSHEVGGISITITIGNQVKALEDIYTSYNTACEMMQNKLLSGKGTVLLNNLESQEDYFKSVDYAEYIKLNKELIRCLSNFDISKADHLIDYFFNDIIHNKVSNTLHIQNYCINIISQAQLYLMDMNVSFYEVFGSETVLWDKLIKFESILDISQWMKNIFKSIIEYIEDKKSRKSNKIVEKVIKYIEEGYSGDITIKDIANELYYSQNHLGYLFKSETGRGFSEYLTEYRMKKAEEFLKATMLKTYQIADAVGYSNVNSFIKQFKLVYGMTPKEYRERC